MIVTPIPLTPTSNSDPPGGGVIVPLNDPPRLLLLADLFITSTENLLIDIVIFAYLETNPQLTYSSPIFLISSNFAGENAEEALKLTCTET